jgi:16S rRNA (guanine966-N2)-methyltransferase
MTRIIGGTAGGRRLQTPPGPRTRPTSDRVREALFSRLEHLGVIDGAHVLDLFAGSGALGLEAASRGAATVTLVDSDRRAAAVARGNAAVVAHAGVLVREETVERVLLGGPRPAGGPGADLVFLDPPYDLSEETLADVLALLPAHGWLAPDALVVVERSARTPEPRWPTALGPAQERRYGETRVWFADAPGPDGVA